MGSKTEMLRNKLQPLVEEEDLELVELEFSEAGPASILRMYVDRAGGVSVDHCARLSRTVSDFLDTENLIPDRYTLQVSSPGLERPLVCGADFRRKVGEKVMVYLKEKVGGKTQLVGKIKSLDGENLHLAVELPGTGPDQDSEEVIPLVKVAKAQIVF
jgi:ribosome maturation factor RimP